MACQDRLQTISQTVFFGTARHTANVQARRLENSMRDKSSRMADLLMVVYLKEMK